MEERRTSQRAVVVVTPPSHHGLRAQFGPRTTVLRTLDDGRVEVEIGAPTTAAIAEQLAGWGALIDVVEPAEVRTELARIGRELVERYGAAAAG
jgi:predicted DNA-binding transcriptional regulator YafY